MVSTNARAGADPAPLERYASQVAAGRKSPPGIVLIDGHNPVLAAVGLDLAARVGALSVMDAGSWKDDAANLPGCCDVVAARVQKSKISEISISLWIYNNLMKCS